MTKNLSQNSPQSSPQSSNEKPSFEVALEQLQGAVKKLESGELSLEDSLRQFEEGVKLTRVCQDYLSSAEQRVEILMKSETSNSLELQPFSGSRAASKTDLKNG